MFIGLRKVSHDFRHVIPKKKFFDVVIALQAIRVTHFSSRHRDRDKLFACDARPLSPFMESAVISKFPQHSRTIPNMKEVARRSITRRAAHNV